MKPRILIMPLAAATLGCVLLIVNAQQDDEVRGAFLSTRPKTTNANAPVRRHRRPPRNTNSSASTTARNTNSSRNANGGSARSANANKNLANSNSAASPAESIGLGYTV